MADSFPMKLEFLCPVIKFKEEAFYDGKKDWKSKEEGT
jgi:hypothetical protein